MAEKRDRVEWFEARLALLEHFGLLTVMGGAVGGLLAGFTHFMQRWAPFSWFVGATFGVLAVQTWKLLQSWQREKDERRRRIELLQAPKGQVNPVKTEFRNERIYLTDLLPPLGYEIEGKDFQNCQIVGPANITLTSSAPGLSEMMYCMFLGCDGVIVDSSVWPQNIIALKDCRLRNCKLYNLTLMVPTAPYLQVRAEGFIGMNWLNERPIKALEQSGALQGIIKAEEDELQAKRIQK